MTAPPDLMHSDDDPTDEQLAELMHSVGDAVRERSAKVAKIHAERLAAIGRENAERRPRPNPAIGR